MAIQWADNFTRYGVGGVSVSAMLSGLVYQNMGNISSPGVYEDPDDPNGLAYRLGYNGNAWTTDFRIAIPRVVSTTIGVGVRYYLSQLPSSAGQLAGIIQIQAGDGSIIVYARVELNGGIEIRGKTVASDSLSLIASSAGPLIEPQSWNLFEMVHDCQSGIGSLYLNGEEVLSWNTVKPNEVCKLVNFSARNGAGIASPTFLKDLVIWDDTGTSNNTPLGNYEVIRLRPNADEELGDWEPNVGNTGFLTLAEDAPDDATYMTTGIPPSEAMKFQFEDLPPEISSILGMIIISRNIKSDGGDGSIELALSSDGVNWDGNGGRPITTTFKYGFHVSERNPATGEYWTPDEVDNIVGRIDRTL